jgi:hypothetical protein
MQIKIARWSGFLGFNVLGCDIIAMPRLELWLFYCPKVTLNLAIGQAGSKLKGGPHLFVQKMDPFSLTLTKVQKSEKSAKKKQTIT